MTTEEAIEIAESLRTGFSKAEIDGRGWHWLVFSDYGGCYSYSGNSWEEVLYNASPQFPDWIQQELDDMETK